MTIKGWKKVTISNVDELGIEYGSFLFPDDDEFIYVKSKKENRKKDYIRIYKPYSHLKGLWEVQTKDLSDRFTSKSQALAFARQYMRTH